MYRQGKLWHSLGPLHQTTSKPLPRLQLWQSQPATLNHVTAPRCFDQFSLRGFLTEIFTSQPFPHRHPSQYNQSELALPAWPDACAYAAAPALPQRSNRCLQMLIWASMFWKMLCLDCIHANNKICGIHLLSDMIRCYHLRRFHVLQGLPFCMQTEVLFRINTNRLGGLVWKSAVKTAGVPQHFACGASGI